jgi:EAL domain-containing protein (putative c-di-GMP-specific phosphodiesterase class I)
MSNLAPTVPVFTQKHYEHLIAGLHLVPALHDRIIAAEILCRIFQTDNPKFKPALFMAQAMETGNETPET